MERTARVSASGVQRRMYEQISEYINRLKSGGKASEKMLTQRRVKPFIAYRIVQNMQFDSLSNCTVQAVGQVWKTFLSGDEAERRARGVEVCPS